MFNYFFTKIYLRIKLNTKLVAGGRMKEEYINDMATLLKTMSHPIRLKILCLLKDGDMAVGDIREKVNTTSANVSQHLSMLRGQGFVGSRKDANYIYNRITDNRVLELIAVMNKLFCRDL